MTARVHRAPRPARKSLPGGGIEIAAPAKLNLTLAVGPRREDGFHPLDSAVVQISLYDTIRLMPRDDGQLCLHCDGLPCGAIEDNLALRAGRLLAEGRDTPGVDIHLRKEIPPGAGLGGGSSDAAAVLAGLDELWGLDLPENERLDLAARLGSDVPLFLGPPTLRMRGRGEVLSPLDIRPFAAVLILSGLHCPTGPVYRAFDDAPAPDAWSLALADLAKKVADWQGRLRNDLAIAAMAVCPELQVVRDAAAAALAPTSVHVTGSGSGLFAVFPDAPAAVEACERLPGHIRPGAVVVEPHGAVD